MILSLDEAKLFLRLESEYTDEDTLIQSLIDAATEHLHNATDIVFDNTNPLAKLYVNVLVSDYFDNRGTIEEIKTRTRLTLDSIILQLQYSYGGV